MFIAMNRFKIVKGKEQAFEDIWRSRQCEDHTLYASHALWETRQHFVDWTQSEQFREAHKNAGQNRNLYIGGPEFEGFETVLTEKNPQYAAAAESR